MQERRTRPQHARVTRIMRELRTCRLACQFAHPWVLLLRILGVRAAVPRVMRRHLCLVSWVSLAQVLVVSHTHPYMPRCRWKPPIQAGETVLASTVTFQMQMLLVGAAE